MKKILPIIVFCIAAQTAVAQPSYIVEQLGRNAHQIVQSLGAFVGNERAVSQQFDITYMPAGNRVEGVMIINTADYRCTFKIDPKEEVCYEIILDVRSSDFLFDFNRLFQIYPTDNPNSDDKTLHFGNMLVAVRETPSTTSRFRHFVMTEQK